MAMLSTILDWFGFGGAVAQAGGAHGHSHAPGDHAHTHGVIDPTIATTDRGIWAIKWSFVIMAVTAVLQLGVVLISGSVALLADTIHNFGDATTAIPLWVAFVLARRKPTKTFTYGLGRVEDLAGVLIVLIILFSALVAGYEAIDRLIHPHPITALGWVAVAGVVGFLGNEAVAVFRIRIGREISSAALIADGYHARTDGLTSLAVVIGALGVWLGFPLADPIIGLLITIAIFGIVWQSSKAVFTCMLDGVEPSVIDEIHHAAEHVDGVQAVTEARARWLGHELFAELTITVDEALPLVQANAIAASLQAALFEHLPALKSAHVRFGAPTPGFSGAAPHHGHHHAPDPFHVVDDLAEGVLEIVDTDAGERLRLTTRRAIEALVAVATISRPAGPEMLMLEPVAGKSGVFMSAVAPAEPHTFDGVLTLSAGAKASSLPFHMAEPEPHHQESV
jgi:cation diffusion facilitator family transporter